MSEQELSLIKILIDKNVVCGDHYKKAKLVQN